MPAAWTTPINWTSLLAITASRLNKFVGDDGANAGNLKYLLDERPNKYQYAAGGYTTTSTSYADIDGTNLYTGSLTFSGTRVLTLFAGTGNNLTAGQNVTIEMQMDGTTLSGHAVTVQNTVNATFVHLYLWTVTAGVHYFKPRFLSSSGGTTAGVGACQFWAAEIGG